MKTRSGIAQNKHQVQFCIERLERRQLLAAGTLDTTFNAGTGKRAVNFSGVIDELYDVAIQSDGKIVGVGSKTSTNTFGTGGDIAIVRLLANGTLDTSFGTGGTKLLDWNGDIERANAVAIQSDGKIVIGASTRPAASTFWGDWLIARVNVTDGSLDTTFGIGGRVVTSFGSDDELYDLVIQSDGMILAGGLATPGSNYLGLARYDVNGNPDPNFGGGTGKIATAVFGNLSEATAITVQNDGKIITVGTAASNGPGGGTKTLGICRFNSGGTFDTTFNGTGWVVDNLGFATPTAVAMAPDGGYYVTTTVVSSPPVTQLRKYTSTGARATFGTSGALVIGNGGTLGENTGLQVQSDGRILVVSTTASATSQFYGTTTLARAMPDGTFDSTFGVGGKLVLNEGSAASNLALDAQGRAVAVLTLGYDAEVFRATSDGAASITGRLIRDLDGDLVTDAGEQPLAGWKVYIDLDLDNTFDNGERWMTTDSAGNYRFDQLVLTNPLGGYTIRPIMQAGYNSRLGGIQAFVSLPNQVFDIGDWQIFFGQNVLGNVFNDANGNGVKNTGETGLANVVVYVDANGSGYFDAGEPSGTTNGNGDYTLVRTSSGQVRLKFPVTHRQTSPANDAGQSPAYSAGSYVNNIGFGAVASTFAATVSYDINTRKITYTFDRPVQVGSILFNIQDIDGGVPSPLYTLTRPGDLRVLQLEPTVAGSTAPRLPNGRYRARLYSGSVKDAAGNLQPANATIDFHVLAGDANQDRIVDATDLGILSANWQQVGRTYTQADFNYDGRTDINDLYLLATNWQSSLPAAPASVSTALITSVATRTPVRVAKTVL